MTTDTQSAVAAALMQAADLIGAYENHARDNEEIAREAAFAVAQETILALITPDAMAALEAVKAEARREGMRHAETICRAFAKQYAARGLGDFTAFSIAGDAILAAYFNGMADDIKNGEDPAAIRAGKE